MRRSSRVRAVAMMIAVAVTLTGCTATPMESSERPSAQPCGFTEKLVPTCGVLLGVTPPRPTYASLQTVQAAIGTRIQLLHRFHDIDDRIPDAADRRAAKSGALLHLSIDSRDYRSEQRTTVKWAAVAEGRFDRSLIAQARGIASLRRPVYVTFDHEPDQPKRRAVGTPAEYRAAWRHVHDLFEREGAGDTVWVWTVMGWPRTFKHALTMWPGNAYVDWISWEAYNKAGCTRNDFKHSQWVSFEQALTPFYRYVRRHGAAAGIDVDKPMMISEAATVQDPSDHSAAARWYAAIPTVLRRYPQIKSVTLWDHTGSSKGCDFRFSRDAQVVGAVSGLARNPLMSQRSDG